MKPLIDRVNEDLSKIIKNNSIVKFTDVESSRSIEINGIVLRKDLTYVPLENVSIEAPEHKITVRTADFTLKYNDIFKVKVEWLNADSNMLSGFISSVHKSDTMSQTTFIIKIGIKR